MARQSLSPSPLTFRLVLAMLLVALPGRVASQTGTTSTGMENG